MPLRKRESRQRAKQLKKNIMVEEGSSGRDSLQEHGFSRVGSDECKTLRAQGPPTRRLKVAEHATDVKMHVKDVNMHVTD